MVISIVRLITDPDSRHRSNSRAVSRRGAQAQSIPTNGMYGLAVTWVVVACETLDAVAVADSCRMIVLTGLVDPRFASQTSTPWDSHTA